MRKFLLYIVFALTGVSTFSQTGNDSLIRLDSTTTLIDRSVTKNLSEKYTGEEFNYQVNTGESQNLLLRFLNWIGQGLNTIFGIDLSPETLKVLEIIIYVLMGILVMYLLLRLFTNEQFSSLFSKKAKTVNDINLTEEHIETINLDALLNKALNNEDFRLAVRYQFLLVLQRLSKKEMIDWHFEKTNTDYLTEIKEPSLKQSFRKVSYLYDYIWYGEQTIDSVGYTKAYSEFELINNTINL